MSFCAIDSLPVVAGKHGTVRGAPLPLAQTALYPNNTRYSFCPAWFAGWEWIVCFAAHLSCLAGVGVLHETQLVCELYNPPPPPLSSLVTMMCAVRCGATTALFKPQWVPFLQPVAPCPLFVKQYGGRGGIHLGRFRGPQVGMHSIPIPGLFWPPASPPPLSRCVSLLFRRRDSGVPQEGDF